MAIRGIRSAVDSPNAAIIRDVLRVLMPNDAGVLELAEVPGDFVPTDSWAWFDVVLESPRKWFDSAAGWASATTRSRMLCSDVHLPKVDDYGDHVFVVLHGVSESDGMLSTVELDAVVGRRFLLTVRRGPSPSVDWVIENGARQAEGPDVVLARITEAMSRRLLPLIEALDEASIDIEESAIAGRGDVVAEIQALRRDSIQLRRFAQPQREVLGFLAAGGFDVVGDRARQRFASARDHHIRTVEALDSARLLLSSTLESYRGAVAEKMNEVMKVLTVYAAILLPLTLLAGIYGMNFTNIPELEWRWGYFGLLGVMASVAVAQWIYFARRGFVGRFPIKRIPTTVGKGLARLAKLPIDAAGFMIGLASDSDRAGDEDR